MENNLLGLNVCRLSCFVIYFLIIIKFDYGFLKRKEYLFEDFFLIDVFYDILFEKYFDRLDEF